MKWKAWLLGVVLLLLLSGCNPDSGLAWIEVSYPSGYVRTSTTWDELTPVEGADCHLRAQKAEDYDKTYHYDLQILDGAGICCVNFRTLDRPRCEGSWPGMEARPGCAASGGTRSTATAT